MTSQSNNNLKTSPIDGLQQYLKPDVAVKCNEDGVYVSPISVMTAGMQANDHFFSHPKWSAKYFECENHRNLIGERWRAASGSWEGKVVVDLGCGPGNLFCAVDGKPKVLIGVDISANALKHASKLGYTPLLADVHDTPLVSGFADLVTLNATLHHTDDMPRVLAEAARLVKPGGMLITDEDPLASDYTIKGLGKIAARLRACIRFFRVRNHPTRSWKHVSFKEDRERQKTEIHNRFAGDGIQKKTFSDVLEPLGFTVNVYPHGHLAGKSIFDKDRGTNSDGIKIIQRLSGINPSESALLLSVMCVAYKRTG